MSESNHNNHTCKAVVITCIDFRLVKYFRKWSNATIHGEFDRVAIAGGVKNLPFVLDQVELSYKLHHICDVYLINHEDCGAYGTEGTLAKHKKDLEFAKRILHQKFPKLKIIPLYLKLSGEFVEV